MTKEEVYVWDNSKGASGGCVEALGKGFRYVALRGEVFAMSWEHDSYEGWLYIDQNKSLGRVADLKLRCGCHCSGGCGDPYAACMQPCKEHVPY